MTSVHKKIIARNKRARFDYFIEETLEAGIMLMGSEIKSLRLSKASINEAYASDENENFFLINAYIPEYKLAKNFAHDPRQPRKLLLRKREMNRLRGLIKQKGVTLVPIALYFNEKGLAKLELGLATGKKKHEKREVEKQRDWDKQKSRILRENN